MLPVLFSLGNLPISSFGFFLSLAFLFGTFLTYRLARAFELEEEKILDLAILTFFGGLIGARIYFIAAFPQAFLEDFFRIFSLVRFPGLSFWGGFFGGFLALFIFLKRSNLLVWQILDIASVGMLGGLILGSIGCFLGGCGVGIPSHLLGVKMVGVVGDRLPVQLVEALLFSVALAKIWPKAIHFHTPGVILGQTFIWIGAIKFLTDFLKPDQSGQMLNIILASFGVYILYRILKRNFLADVKAFVFDQETRQVVLNNLIKQWYNQKVLFLWRIHNLNRQSLLLLNKLLRRINVKATPKDTGFN